MIRVIDLSVKFGNQVILNNIQQDFNEGLIHGVVGLNGAGKTTLFNTLSGIIKPNVGKILYQDKPLTHSKIGYLEANNFFYSNITGNEHLNIFSKTNSDFDIQALNELTRIPLDNLIETYSSGMKKKLAMLALIKKDNPIYILDEPFNSLDFESSKVLELITMNLKMKSKTIFISSHIIETLTPICDHIHLMENGVFKKTFDPPTFQEIENALLGEFKASAKKIIDKSM